MPSRLHATSGPRRVVVAAQRVLDGAVQRERRLLLHRRVVALARRLRLGDRLGQARVLRRRTGVAARRWRRDRRAAAARRRRAARSARRVPGRACRHRSARRVLRAPWRPAVPADPVGGPAGIGPPSDRAEVQPRRLAERARLVALLAGHRDDEVVAVLHHLGAADAEPVDALVDDLARQVELVGRRRGAGLGARGQRDPGAALEVDAELGRRRAVPGEEDQPVERGHDHDEGGQIAPGRESDGRRGHAALLQLLGSVSRGGARREGRRRTRRARRRPAPVGSGASAATRRCPSSRPSCP